tara:strand:+ start:274 stop:525 length:252 start_codon:yes stop_codon:yes gene_type:complete
MIDSYRYDSSDLLQQRQFALAAVATHNKSGVCTESYEFCDKVIQTGKIAEIIERHAEGGDMMAAFAEVNELYEEHLKKWPPKS